MFSLCQQTKPTQSLKCPHKLPALLIITDDKPLMSLTMTNAIVCIKCTQLTRTPQPPPEGLHQSASQSHQEVLEYELNCNQATSVCSEITKEPVICSQYLITSHCKASTLTVRAHWGENGTLIIIPLPPPQLYPCPTDLDGPLASIHKSRRFALGWLIDTKQTKQF